MIAELSNEQKVAVVLASLEEETAASVLQQLDPPLAARVVGHIRTLGIIPGSVREQILQDCMLGINEMRNAVRGGEATATNLLTKAIGEKRAVALLSGGEEVEKEPFSGFGDVSPEQIATALSREQPGVIGTVLRYLPSEKAAEVMSLLPSEVRKQTSVFMCRAETPSDEVIRQIEAFMEGKVIKSGKSKRRKDDTGNSVAIMASILQHVDRSVEEELLDAVDGYSAEVGNEIKERLFTFEDVIRLGDPDIRQILQQVDTATLAVSLRGCSIDVREKFFNNMSKRAAAGLKEEMELAPKMKMSEVDAKQKEIVNIIRQLDASGQISISQGGDDTYV